MIQTLLAKPNYLEQFKADLQKATVDSIESHEITDRTRA
jgi:hypothetical protein